MDSQAHRSNSDFKILRRTFSGIQEEEKERFHAYHELYYIAEGSCSVFIGRRTFKMNAGDFAIIPGGTLHKTDFSSTGHNVKFVVSFSRKTARQIDAFLGEPLTQQCMQAGRVTAPLQRRESVGIVLGRMLYEYDNQPLHAQSFFKACLAELLISILRYRTHQEENESLPDPRTDRMQTLAAYICDHASEDLNLELLASRFALSPSYLSRSFKQATGFGFREYLISVRIQRATDLLLNTELTITEIADQCGFSDSNYFGDAFRRATGLSPRDYRRLGS